MDTDAKGSRTGWALKAAIGMIAVGAIAVLYVLFAASSKPEQHSSDDLTRFAKGAIAQLEAQPEPPVQPTRQLRDAAGAATTLEAYKGQVVVLNLWATWCAPCMEEMPTLGALQRRFGDRIRVVPINVDGDAKLDEAKSELTRLGQGSLPFLNDPTRGVLFDVASAGMPVTIFYDRQGRERARLTGGADWSSDDAAALVEALLAEG